MISFILNNVITPNSSLARSIAYKRTSMSYYTCSTALT